MIDSDEQPLHRCFICLVKLRYGLIGEVIACNIVEIMSSVHILLAQDDTAPLGIRQCIGGAQDQQVNLLLFLISLSHRRHHLHLDIHRTCCHAHAATPTKGVEVTNDPKQIVTIVLCIL